MSYLTRTVRGTDVCTSSRMLPILAVSGLARERLELMKWCKSEKLSAFRPKQNEKRHYRFFEF